MFLICCVVDKENLASL